MKIIYILLLISLALPTHADCVILLHGLARSSDSMSKLETELKKHHYKVQNISYESRKYDIQTLAKSVIEPALSRCNHEEKVNFVTHSMGGILVRQFLSERSLPNLNRVVMLGPPNKGSEVVDKLGKFPGFHFINGDAGLQLGTGNTSIPNSIGGANFELGIIAGTRSMNLILSTIIPGPDDGKVSIKSTKLDGMKDHIAMPVTHTFMMKNAKVIAQVIQFLKDGKFNQKDQLL